MREGRFLFRFRWGLEVVYGKGRVCCISILLEVELVRSCDIERSEDDAVTGYDVAEENFFGRKRIRIEID